MCLSLNGCLAKHQFAEIDSALFNSKVEKLSEFLCACAGNTRGMLVTVGEVARFAIDSPGMSMSRA